MLSGCDENEQYFYYLELDGKEYRRVRFNELRFNELLPTLEKPFESPIQQLTTLIYREMHWDMYWCDIDLDEDEGFSMLDQIFDIGTELAIYIPPPKPEPIMIESNIEPIDTHISDVDWLEKYIARLNEYNESERKEYIKLAHYHIPPKTGREVIQSLIKKGRKI